MEQEMISNKIKDKWVVLLNEQIVLSGDDIKEIIKEAQIKYPQGKFILAKVPEEGAMIY